MGSLVTVSPIVVSRPGKLLNLLLFRATSKRRHDLEMKISIVILIAAIGVVMVAADESLESRLRTALKSLLQDKLQNEEKEDLEMEARDSVTMCERDTRSCDGHGSCQQSTFGQSYGQYICFCDSGYRGNSYGGCSASSAREVEYLSNFARDVELELLTRDTLARCNQDTSNCDGFGECVQSTFGLSSGQFICRCNDGYRNNLYGGCSARTKREMEYLTMIARDQGLEMQARDTLAQCNRDTENCDGFGECVKSTFGRTTGQFICRCNDGYANNLYGGCSLEATGVELKNDEEMDKKKAYAQDADEEERTMELMRRLAELYQE